MTVCNLCLLVNIFVKFLEIQELVYYSLKKKHIYCGFNIHYCRMKLLCLILSRSKRMKWLQLALTLQIRVVFKKKYRENIFYDHYNPIVYVMYYTFINLSIESKQFLIDNSILDCPNFCIHLHCPKAVKMTV